MSKLPSILVVEDVRLEQEFLEPALSRPDESLIEFHGCGPFRVDLAGCGSQARKSLDTKKYDMVLLDLRLPENVGDAPDQEVGKRILKVIPKPPATAVVAITLYASVEDAVQVLTGGAVDFINRLLDPDAAIVYGTVARAYLNLCQERRECWHRADVRRRIVRGACRLRNQSDRFTKIAADVLTRVAESSRSLRRLLQSRIGLSEDEDNRDELAVELTEIDQAVKKGGDEFCKLREDVPLEMERSGVSVRETCEALADEVRQLAATRHQQVTVSWDGEDSHCKVYSRDFHDSALEVLFCALQHAEAGATIELRPSVDRDRKRLRFAAAFRRSESPFADTNSGSAELYEIEETMTVVREFAKRMGGDGKAGPSDRGLFQIEFCIPVGL